MVSSVHSFEQNPWDDEPTVIYTGMPLPAARPGVARQSSAHVGLAAPSRKRAPLTQPASVPEAVFATGGRSPTQSGSVRLANASGAGPHPLLLAAKVGWQSLALADLIRDPQRWLGNTQRAMALIAALAGSTALGLLWLVLALGRS